MIRKKVHRIIHLIVWKYRERCLNSVNDRKMNISVGKRSRISESFIKILRFIVHVWSDLKTVTKMRSSSV